MKTLAKIQASLSSLMMMMMETDLVHEKGSSMVVLLQELVLAFLGHVGDNLPEEKGPWMSQREAPLQRLHA
jgi:hypothetical protein